MKNIINLFALLILPALSVPSLSQDQNLGKAVQKVIDKYQDAKALKLDAETVSTQVAEGEARWT